MNTLQILIQLLCNHQSNKLNVISYFHSHQLTQNLITQNQLNNFITNNISYSVNSCCNSFLLKIHPQQTNENKLKHVNSYLYLALQPKQLTPAEIADMAHHFSVNNQDLNFSGTHCRDNFNREQLTTLFEAMMQTPYNISDDVGDAATKAIDTFQYAELQANKKSDPYYISKFILQFQAGLGQIVLPFGSGFLTGRVNQNIQKNDLQRVTMICQNQQL
ncbi:unnamed protein product [Paramecium pentaurelia]|uniref:Uncharacterized protein n=1 Tax=Paramecium pentaurelia TaxID=43138 RepID=A0A8S1WCK3_9CILI|nr:unnamed protein product [Paramecium pentaurelia]